MLALIDMGLGNLQSVANAFARVGARTRIVSRPADLEDAAGIVLPGVGAFGAGMARLGEQGLVEPLRRIAREERRPVLGICLGLQLMADEGEEHGRHEGLGLIRGRVVRLQPSSPGCRVPNMGWCPVTVTRQGGPLLGRIADGQSFYFAHSYAVQCDDADDVVATIDYGGPIVAAVERGHLAGVQFHPEKSQDAGLALLEAFCERVGELAAR